MSQLSRKLNLLKTLQNLYPTNPLTQLQSCTREIPGPLRGLDVFFILRAKSEGSSRWSGQVGFPGGHVELGEEEGCTKVIVVTLRLEMSEACWDQILEFVSFRFSWFGANDPGVSGGSKFTWEFSNVFHDWWFKGPCCRCTRMQRGGWTLFGPLAATGYVQPFWYGYMILVHTIQCPIRRWSRNCWRNVRKTGVVTRGQTWKTIHSQHWAPQRCKSSYTCYIMLQFLQLSYTHGLSSKVSWGVLYPMSRLQVQLLSKHVSFASTWCLP